MPLQDGQTFAAATQSAVAHEDGNTYPISGTAPGVDLANQLAPSKKSFELVAVCP